jgi:hypothetical protein
MLEEGVNKPSYLIQFRFSYCYFYYFYSKVRFHNSQYVNYIYTQVRKSEQEVDLRPITPSKIPVGAWRAKEERAITRALSSSLDSNRPSRVGCALTFASEAKFEIEAKISFRLEAKKMPDFT